MIAAVAFLFLCACERRQIGERGASDDRSTARTAVAEEGEDDAEAGRQSHAREAEADSSNEAVRLSVVSSRLEATVAGSRAPHGRVFVALQTNWQNIHPKQEVEKSKLEGKRDHTLGVGGFARGETSTDREYVEVDVAYKIPQLRDHVYLLGDGVAYALGEGHERVKRAIDPGSELVIENHGDVRDLELVFVVPERTEHLALQLLDYSYGHVIVPVRGKLRRARGDGRPPKGCVDGKATENLEIATRSVDFRETYGGSQAGTGRTFAVVDIVGKSLSEGGSAKNIVEIDPTQNLWVTADGGFIHYARQSDGARGRPIRFTPEVFQHQTVVFLVPDTADRLRFGMRERNQVVELDLTERRPKEMPRAKATHGDGDVMEVLYFGSRRQAHQVILDLGIRPLAGERGLEIQPSAQFMLVAGARELKMDAGATAALPHPPPKPFVVPPGTPVRFELAFTTDDTPTDLKVRGFRSEAKIGLE
jgi:hypothetical protein